MASVLSPLEYSALYAVVAIAIVALAYAFFLRKRILKEPPAAGRVKEVWEGIRAGANAYLRVQFKSMLLLIGFLAIFLYFSASLDNSPLFVALGRVGAFLMGTFFSAMVGYIGMNMAVQGSIRVAESSKKGFREALKIAYRTGTITGMLTDGLGLLGGVAIFLIYVDHSPEVLLGFGFGGTLLALFMRVGGGIYTKAADIGADLVGKVERGIPEDDPRNAAVVADLVGDNVGDCAGMAADIFESYEVTMVSALILGLAIATQGPIFEAKWIIFPILVRGIGVISTLIGTYMVAKWPDKLTKGDAFKAMDLSYDLSSAISAASFLVLSLVYVNDIRVFLATTVGIILAISFNKLADYFTSPNRNPVDGVAKSSKTGPATVILQGFALGFESTVWTILLVALTIVISMIIWAGAGFLFASYGIALAGIGMLTQTGNNVAMDTFGPIVDNANGIGEMAGLQGNSRKILADLDASGNTTKSVTKAIAIASAVIAAISLFSSFTETVHVSLDIATDPLVFVGLLIGGALPFLFSFISIRAVGRAASKIIEEVRKQFRIPGVMEGTKLPDYAKVVGICTSAAQRELASIAIIAILTPITIGLILSPSAWGGFLAGVILTGQLLAVFMANSGGAWDNAKKKIEDGYYGGKGSESHKASVIGDTVGDPLKDTAGPALNPMIKVMNLVSLLFAGSILALKDSFIIQVPILNIEIPIVATALAIILVIIIGVAIFYSKRETKEEEQIRDIDAPIFENVIVDPNPVMANALFTIKGVLDDSRTGGSRIVSAEYSFDGASWFPMTAADGKLDTQLEQLTAKAMIEKPGIYLIVVRGADEMGNVTAQECGTIIVYDPAAGSAIGEGWVESPEGAYTEKPQAKGKATFQFTVGYQKDTGTPVGQTEFAFPAAELNFRSERLDWLVITDEAVHFTGTGLLNGAKECSFALIAMPATVAEGKPARFRLTLWEKQTGQVIYDSDLGNPDSAYPITKVAGGAITIKANVHSSAKKKSRKADSTDQNTD